MICISKYKDGQWDYEVIKREDPAWRGVRALERTLAEEENPYPHPEAEPRDVQAEPVREPLDEAK
jgi:hypothetical protein